MASPFARWGWAALAALALLGLLRTKPWRAGPAARPGAGEGARRESLDVGFLPVT